MTGVMWILLCLMGLCWGSFINVVMTRTLIGESIIFPPSKCPKCGHHLYWWHNIPILSFLLLKGKCYFCNKTISIRYPIVEIAGLCIFVFAFTKYISIVDAVAVILILSNFLVLAYTDIKERKVSILQAFIIILAGVVFNRYDIYNALSGCVLSAGAVLALGFFGRKVFKKETFGVGDIYLLGALGSVAGFDKIILFVLYALVIQFIFILPNYILGLIRNEQLETLRYLILFGCACLFLYVFRNISFHGSKVLLILILSAIVFFAYKLILNLISSVKNQENPLYCPLAPAIALSCLIFLC